MRICATLRSEPPANRCTEDRPIKVAASNLQRALVALAPGAPGSERLGNPQRSDRLQIVRVVNHVLLGGMRIHEMASESSKPLRNLPVAPAEPCQKLLDHPPHTRLGHPVGDTMKACQEVEEIPTKLELLADGEWLQSLQDPLDVLNPVRDILLCVQGARAPQVGGFLISPTFLPCSRHIFSPFRANASASHGHSICHRCAQSIPTVPRCCESAPFLPPVTNLRNYGDRSEERVGPGLGQGGGDGVQGGQAIGPPCGDPLVEPDLCGIRTSAPRRSGRGKPPDWGWGTVQAVTSAAGSHRRRRCRELSITSGLRPLRGAMRTELDATQAATYAYRASGRCIETCPSARRRGGAVRPPARSGAVQQNAKGARHPPGWCAPLDQPVR